MDKVRQTLSEMLEDRGFDGSSIPTIDPDDEECHFFVKHKDTPQRVGLMYICAKVGIKAVKQVEEMLNEVESFILIYGNAVTPSAKAYIDSAHLCIELFHKKELMFNVTKHSMVPKHEIIDKQTKLQLCTEHKVSEKQFPRILKTDPVARYLGLKPGQLVKITRPSETAGTFCSYRICT